MAAHTHTTYTCDRCKGALGGERPCRSQQMRVQWSANFAEGPGPSGDWVDLCDDCFNACYAFLIGDPGARGASRDWLQKLIERAATDGEAVKLLHRAALCIGWKPGQ